MRIRGTGLILLALALAAPAAASAELRVDGRGFGHGIGLSQYGAYGYALREGRSFDWILQHYYPGTELTRTGSRAVRVLLRRASSQTVCGATLARGADGRRVRLREQRSYRLSRSSRGRLRLRHARRTLALLSAPVRVTGGRDVCLRGTAENGVRNGRYRGMLTIDRDGARTIAVNRLRIEHYLYGVVPAEMPTSWPIEAVKAQAVAARTYALRGLPRGGAYDVFADTRSQVYRGLTAETPAGTAAVRATQALAVTYGGALAHTFFFSTSGGRTAAIEEVWNAAPVPYLISVDDPYDDLSPVHTWSLTFSRDEAERRLGGLVRGRLEQVVVTERTPSGRARTVEVRGSDGVRSATGPEIRTRLGLRSSWFTTNGP